VYFPFVHPQEIARSIIPYWQVLLASNTTASDAISWKDLEERVKDRIVLVGPTFIESQDFFAHPFALSGNLTRIPGVFLHAMVANSAFLPKTVYRLPRAWEQIIASAFLVTGLVLSWVLSPAIGFMAFLLLSGLYVAAGVGLFSRNLIWIPLAAPLFSSAIALIPNLAVRLLDSERKRVMVKDLFSKYVSADVLEHVQAHPELLKLEGERREVTVFFSDLKGFTTISETMTPEKLSQIMNDYLTPMTEIIMYHQGYLDKYIGDAIMAVFGAPMSDPEHALHACLAAVKQRNRLRKLAKELEEACGVKVSARMGVNSGMVCAGNMGSKDRFQYTVMGDVVNQASRFEGANKIFGSVIMIGEGTFVAAQDRIIARKLAHLTVKGKTQAVVVYELLEVKAICSEAEAASLSALCQSFNQAMEAFFKGDINEAAAQFDAILATHPDDGPSRFYLDDCRGLLAQGKPASFTGGIKLDSK